MPQLLLNPVHENGRVLALDSKPITFGRAPDNTVRINDDRASRYHCVVEPDAEGGAFVKDLGSKNGTRVNGTKVESARLKAGDLLNVAGLEWTVQIGASAKEADVYNIAALPRGLAKRKLPPWADDLTEQMLSVPPKGEFEDRLQLIDAGGEPSTVLVAEGDGPLAARLLLQFASKARATDIHIEPKQDETFVRMRVDGDMVSIAELPENIASLVLGLVKSICQMKSAARDAVQDGHFSCLFPDRRVEYRASFTPSMHGQKLVLRVLDQRLAPTNVADLGMPNWIRERIRRVCENDQGMMLCCGPTGSGKTTTLYNALREIDRSRRNVITIEDPVEYQIDGVTQIPVDFQKGNTFGMLLRSVLRQDPDIILVGEIRDEETARTAMQAAMTGHVVFSTVHSKDSISAIFRLLDLKVEPYLIANSLDLILAQRLVRLLCENCKREIPIPAGVLSRLGRFIGNKTTSYLPTGCTRCLRTGYRGRRGLFELLDVSDELRDVILHEPKLQAIKKATTGDLFQTLAQSGWRLVAEGVTSLEEVEQVTGG